MADYPVLEREINGISGKIKNPKVRQMFLNCFYSTLKTTTEIMEDGTTYIFTGDIPAMWLRDSSAQVTGYSAFCLKG
jgi:meiotically up-regulated gene 157 (Mug157) protein